MAPHHGPALFQLLAEGVHRSEGTVIQFTGDGIMVLFGAPIAHEENAQRACYAALHLREEQELRRGAQSAPGGSASRCGQGLNSGEVIVGTIGDDLRLDYTAQGHTVGLAARKEQLASPDTIYVTAHMARLVIGHFDLQDLDRFHVKGVREPIGVLPAPRRGTATDPAGAVAGSRLLPFRRPHRRDGDAAGSPRSRGGGAGAGRSLGCPDAVA